MQRARRPAWMGKPDFGAAFLVFALLVTPGAGTDGAEDQPKLVVKSEPFDNDPNWEGHNNRLLPMVIPTITQDFGYKFATAKGTKGKVDRGPVLTPGKVFDWSLVYDPAANGGQGEICVTLGKETVTLGLKPGQKAEGASLDRFGLFTSTAGGQLARIFLDDLEYTALREEPGPVVRTLEGHSGYVLAVAFSPDQKTLASGSVDLTANCWQAAVRMARSDSGSLRLGRCDTSSRVTSARWTRSRFPPTERRW